MPSDIVLRTVKEYAKYYGLHWGFVRDMDNELYLNNTEYVEDMYDDRWQPIDDALSGLPIQPKPKQMSFE